MSDITRIDIAEFRRLGYLQELNRRFLHPLGLALEVVVAEVTGEERLGGVWDYRDDGEGMRYGEGEHAPDAQRARDIDELLKLRGHVRREALGYVIQPVAGARNLDDLEVAAGLVAKLAELQAKGGYVELTDHNLAIDITELELTDDDHRALVRLGLRPVAQ